MCGFDEKGRFALFSEVLPNMIMVSMPPVLSHIGAHTLGTITQVPADRPLSWRDKKVSQISAGQLSEEANRLHLIKNKQTFKSVLGHN